MGLTCEIRKIGDVTVLDLSGKINAEACESGSGPVLHERVRDLCREGKQKMLLNLRQVVYVDSAGIGELIACMTSARNHDSDLKICGANPRVHDVMQITRLSFMIDVKADEPAALRAFALQKGTSVA